MALFDLFGKRPAPILATPFSLDFSYHPLRLTAHKQDYVLLTVSIKNTSETEQLSSFIITVPHGLGFEATGLNTQREIRLGHLQPGEEKKFRVNIYSNKRTTPGDYSIKLYAASHYRNYGYLINEVRKSFTLRVV